MTTVLFKTSSHFHAFPHSKEVGLIVLDINNLFITYNKKNSLISLPSIKKNPKQTNKTKQIKTKKQQPKKPHHILFYKHPVMAVVSDIFM